MYVHETTIRVRYGETDKMGYLYYGNYALYYEVGRVEMLRSLGLTYREMEDNYSILLPVIELQVRYIKPAYYDDVLCVRTILAEKPTKILHFKVEIYNESDVLINKGEVKLAFFDPNLGKAIQAPDFFMEKIAGYFE